MTKRGHLKIVCIGGTRPEAIKLAPLFFSAHKGKFEMIYLHTGQHRELGKDVFKWFSIQPIRINQEFTGRANLSEKLADLLAATSKKLSAIKPDIVCVQGDTLSALAGALSAHYLRLPLAHVEAGLRTQNKLNPWPEEVTRMLIAQLADIHFSPTVIAKKNLVREGISPTAIHIVGNTVVDSLCWSDRKLSSKLSSKRSFFLVTAHRRELDRDRIIEISKLIVFLTKEFRMDAYFPLHPRSDIRRSFRRILKNHPNVFLCSPLPYAKFIQTLKSCSFVLTDSGGVQEEAACLAKPLIILRDSTERPEVLSAKSHLYRTRSGLLKFLHRKGVLSPARKNRTIDRKIFGDGRSAVKILSILENWGPPKW